ncbi:hypothetical protein, partial [Salmonella enterica]|uniref:hypothetical protein n=1 Tax=Salmonella enterica TaxID=28901 RepID=UPI003D2A9EBE
MPTRTIKLGDKIIVQPRPSAGDYGIKESWPVVITVESKEGPISVQYNADRTCYAKFASKHNQFGQAGKG